MRDRPWHGLAAALVVRPLHHDGAVVVALDGDRLDHGVRQGALGPLDRHRAAVDLHVHPGRHGDRQLPDAGHGSYPLTRRRRGLPRPRRSSCACRSVCRPLDVEMIATPRPPEHPGQVGRLRVDPQAGLGHPAQARDAALPVAAVLELDRPGSCRPRRPRCGARDVALALQDLGDRHLELRVRHHHLVVVGRVGVAQTREHVCDRIGHRHGTLLLSPPWFPDGTGPAAIEVAWLTSCSC